MGGDRRRADLSELPEGCIADAVALTTPRDACALSSVSSLFKSAAESDAVWRKLLPPDIHAVIARSVHSSSYSSLKNLYLSLCNHPILIDAGNLSFSLCKRSGKKCYMISARGLSIAWGDTPRYWYWRSTPDSRFGEVAELNNVCWLEISGKIRVSMLSPGTVYGVYLVFKGTRDSYGFASQPVDVKLSLVGAHDQQQQQDATERSIYLINANINGDKAVRNRYLHQPNNNNLRRLQHVERYKQQQQQQQHQMMMMMQTATTTTANVKMSSSSERRDGWSEVELGDLFIGGGGDGDGEVEIRVSEVKVCNWKRGLIVEGIEFRPKLPSSY